VLAVIDRESALGRRDYAMVLLLAVYGLRASEVVRLRLDAIDWRKQQLHVRTRKAGNSTVYPLDAAVGTAIMSYLESGRPASEHREVFLSSRSPFKPFTTSGALSHHTRKYMAKVGIGIERPGTHVFRYSCAQRLFEQGMPLKVIGDFLGHGNPESTRRYTKIAFDRLREVALGDGEDVL
jgi:integrase